MHINNELPEKKNKKMILPLVISKRIKLIRINSQ